MNEEEKRKYEAFQYWIQTNTERGVTTIPDNLCLFVINLIKSLQKENTEFEKLSKDCSYSVDIVRENTRLRRQVFDLELEKKQKGADYTKVYLKGVYDERERWELKVKSNIKKYRKLADETYKIFRESNSKDRDSHDAGLYFDGHVSALEEII